MTSGQVLVAVLFLIIGSAAGVYGVSMLSQAAAWMTAGLLCITAGLMPFVRSLR